ncbi:MAG TPA: DUF4097 family beta strand repeat-containing protein [Vicinamibacterales bacterium]|nr:DUF4097 family beta strand repeat-containing protein [Vicinamibacterales bacterium]
MRFPTMQVPKIGLLPVVLAALVLGGCDVVVSSLNAKARAEQDWARTYPLSATGTVEIQNGNGRISVTGGEGTQVEVKARVVARASTDQQAQEFLKQIEIREDAGADRVRLETTAPRVSGSHAEVEYEVVVPSGATLRLVNTNGQIAVSGVAGAVRAETTNGGVKGRELSGQVEASTTNGGVDLEVLTVAEGGIRAETTNGGVSLHLPADARADLRASCVNGGISLTGLALEGGQATRRRVDGRLNGGGPMVSLETTNGGIRIASR